MLLGLFGNLAPCRSSGCWPSFWSGVAVSGGDPVINWLATVLPLLCRTKGNWWSGKSDLLRMLSRKIRLLLFILQLYYFCSGSPNSLVPDECHHLISFSFISSFMARSSLQTLLWSDEYHGTHIQSKLLPQLCINQTSSISA
jgi:hypothetical protein